MARSSRFGAGLELGPGLGVGGFGPSPLIGADHHPRLELAK